MTSAVQRVPHLAHWGAFTAPVENGRIVGCEPFVGDPSPSRMLESIVPSVYSERRIRCAKAGYTIVTAQARRVAAASLWSKWIGMWRWISWRRKFAGSRPSMAAIDVGGVAIRDM